MVCYNNDDDGGGGDDDGGGRGDDDDDDNDDDDYILTFPICVTFQKHNVIYLDVKVYQTVTMSYVNALQKYVLF